MITRRTLASLLAFALVVGLVVLVARQPVPYVTYSPGPTIDVLGEFDGEEIIEVSRRTYADDGAFRYQDHGVPWSVNAPNLTFNLVRARNLAAYVGTAKFSLVAK